MQMFPRIRAVQWVLFGCLFVSASASAFDESLSFRRTASGSIEAVVSGFNIGCAYDFLPPNQITLQGGTFTITAPTVIVRNCTIPTSHDPYSVTADLGILHGQSYDVVWNQPLDSGAVAQLTAVLSPSAIGGGVVAMPAPTLSWWGLALLAFVLSAFAMRHRHVARSKF